MKITSYNIVASTNYAELVSQINERINQGWQPYGSLSSTSISINDKSETKIQTNFFQPIVLYSENPQQTKIKDKKQSKEQDILDRL